MLKVTTNTDGLDALIARLEGEGMEEVTEAMASAVLEEADKSVPVRHGRLKKTGRVEPRPGKAHAVAYGSRRAWYVLPVHARTEFLRRAALGHARKVRAAAVAALKRVIHARGPLPPTDSD